MDTSVTMQDNLSISPWPIIAMVVIALGIAFLFLFPILKKKFHKEKKEVEQIARPIEIRKPFNPQAIKSEYLQKVYHIQQDLQTGLTDERKASQQLSATIRDFVNEMTGLNVQNYTLSEIRTLNIPALEELISEYYSPEFSEEKGWDSATSIEKTKRAINQWM